MDESSLLTTESPFTGGVTGLSVILAAVGAFSGEDICIRCSLDWLQVFVISSMLDPKTFSVFLS